MFVKHPLALACAVILSQIAHAEDSTHDTLVLDTQVVSATRSAQNISSLPYTVQLIEREDIQRQAQAGQDLGSILGQMIPGLAPGDNSASSFYQNLRGRSVLVLIDGVAQRSNRAISRQLTSISPASIERIEVINGATSIYGAGATGGVINIITKRADTDEVQMNTTLGFTTSTEETDSDSHSYNIAQTVSGKSGKLDYLVSGSYEQRGSFFDATGDQIATDPNQVSRDNSNTLDILVNTGYQIDKDKKLTLGVEYFKDEMDTDYAADFGDPTAATLGLPQGLLVPGGTYTPTPRDGLTLSQQPETERKSISLEFNDQDFLGQSLITQLNYRENDAYFYPYPGVPLYIATNWDNVLAAAIATPPANQTAAFGLIQANVSGATGSLLQSHIDTRVIDFKLAMNTEMDLGASQLNLTYGLDYINDNGKQTSIEYDYNQWLASGQTNYRTTGGKYSAGPEATTETTAIFLQSQLQLTDDLSLSAGVRQEMIKIEVDDYLSAIDQVNANHYNSELQNTSLQTFAGALGMTPEALLELSTNTIAAGSGYGSFIKYANDAKVREGGEENYHATLVNLGVLYNITDTQETYLNFSQGFTVPDMTRLLRSISILSDLGNQGPILDATNVKTIKTDSVDLGWRMRGSFWDTHVSIFHNRSDRNINFDATTGVVTINDQIEEIQGFELSVNSYLASGLTAGASYAYTEGTTRDENKKKIDLGVDRISPQKLTGYLGFNKPDYDVRLQLMYLADYSDANKDRPALAVDFKGYTTADLLGSYQLPVGRVSAGIRNLTNEDYMPLYNQVRGFPAQGAATYLAAQGRTLSLGYSIDY